MTYITATLTIVITLCFHQPSQTLSYNYDYTNTYLKEYTRSIFLKQGTLQGIVVAFRTNHALPPVEQYKGIPYAAPPVGELRFMPSGSAPSWFGTKLADSFGRVCPQKFPDPRTMTSERRDEFNRLKEFLEDESEDCLYLNIYAPFQGNGSSTRRYPVMVYIHGESFEWNSGNPYDGSVLAAYGKVIVVTLNYRLGVLGFLKAGTEEYSKSNFGLVDQIAALLWVKDNVAAFGGDPNTITLFGHGTGAVCASLLMLTPMVLQDGNKTLFQRAILMGGSALSDWALAGKALQVTYQVAQALNCQIHDNFAACLRRKRLDEIMAAANVTFPYRTCFGPVVDSLVVPNDPKKLMTTYSDMFRRFELMYGVTEVESIHLLGPEALKHGMLEKDRDTELRKYLRSRCEMKPELCVTRTLAEYTDSEFTLDDEKYGGYTGHEPGRASLARDALLEILSDGRTVAPMVQMAQYHASLNQQSYFYVFTHKAASKQYVRDKSYTGEELPYIFGVPLGGSNFPFSEQYTEKERLFSEIIMTYFCNFAYTGDPNVPRKDAYNTLGPSNWIQFDVDWPEYDLKQQQYLQLGIPPYVLSEYRRDEIRYWNEIFPSLAYNESKVQITNIPLKTNTFPHHKSLPPWILLEPPGKVTGINRYTNFYKPLTTSPTFGTVKIFEPSAPDNMMTNGDATFGAVQNSPDYGSPGLSATITIALGSIFLLTNICIFVIVYLRRCVNRKRRMVTKPEEAGPESVDEIGSKLITSDCNIMRIVSKSSRSEDTYEAVKTRSTNSKLPRQMSNSTIDAHTKVRDWITNEIVYRYSPRFLRRHRRPNKSNEPKLETEALPLNDNSSTLDRTSTRPATPTDSHRNTMRPPLVKSSSIPVQKNKKEKVSVAVDATPAGRGTSVLHQQPIELTKSLDRPDFETPLRRSLTLEDFSTIKPELEQEFCRSTTNINLKYPPQEKSTVIRIEHGHSKSEPVQDLYAYSQIKKFKTFDPASDINVTSLDESTAKVPLTPEESLLTIKRRNFPKVLPDYPSREAMIKKRRSMPISNQLFLPIPEVPVHSQPNSPTDKNYIKFPPAPPIRTTSTLTRKKKEAVPVCQSAPMLAQVPTPSPEPEVSCNNLYVGPLIPKMKKTELSASENSKLNTQLIYDILRTKSETQRKISAPVAKTIITADSNCPIKKIEPKVIIKPSMTRSISDPKKNIPRVMVHDNLPEAREETAKPSQIPTLVKESKEFSSSESSPSEESDTGTVVKK